MTRMNGPRQQGDQRAGFPQATIPPTVSPNAVPPKFGPGAKVELKGLPTGIITLSANESIFAERLAQTRKFVIGEEIFGVGPSQLATILVDKGDRVKVRVDDGRWKGRTGWIASSQVRLRPTQEDSSKNVIDGLTLFTRREIYGEIHRSLMFATFEAQHRFPRDTSASGEFKKFYEELEIQAFKILSEKYNTDIDHLHRIDHEGDVERWPLPHVEDPYKKQ